MAKMRRPTFLQMPRYHEEFEEAFTVYLRKRMDEERGQYIPAENVERFYHGHRWDLASDDSSTNFATHSHEMSIPFESIVQNDLSLVPKNISEIIGAMSAQFRSHLYQTLDGITEKTGNKVDAAAVGDLAEAFKELMLKIEFGVDAAGKVSRPTCIAHPSQRGKLLGAIKRKGTKFLNDLRAIIAAKDKQALEKDAARRAKFVR